MLNQEFAYAGLILPDAEDLDVRPILETAARVLDRHDRSGDRPAKINHKRLAVFGARCGVQLRFQEDSDYGPRIVLEIMYRPGTDPNEDLASRVLSDTVLGALDHCDADVIEWYAPDVLIDRADFIRLRSYVSPRRVFDPVEAEALAMSDRMREVLYGDGDLAPDQGGDGSALSSSLGELRERIGACTPSDLRMGAASWAMTGTLAMVALPVAAAVSVVGVARGMDFRLATQALSVTMLFVALENSQSLQQVFYGITH